MSTFNTTHLPTSRHIHHLVYYHLDRDLHALRHDCSKDQECR